MSHNRLWVVPIFPQGDKSKRNASERENFPTRERRDAAVERKMRDYRQIPSFWPFTADWFWSVKFVSTSKLIKRIQWNSFSHLSCHFPCHLPTTSHLSRVGWFSRAVAFLSFYNPWGKIGTTRSLASQRQGTIYSSLTLARKYKIFKTWSIFLRKPSLSRWRSIVCLVQTAFF